MPKKYILKLTYFDDKEVSMITDDVCIAKFMEAIKSEHLYWDEKKAFAFWTPMKNIRYINVLEYKDAPKQEQNEEAIAESIKELEGEE